MQHWYRLLSGFFFFFKQKTAYEMRISDWSSDVCSSDLDANSSRPLDGDADYSGGDFRSRECVALLEEADIVVTNPPFSLFREYVAQLVDYEKQIGRASCRERVCQ